MTGNAVGVAMSADAIMHWAVTDQANDIAGSPGWLPHVRLIVTAALAAFPEWRPAQIKNKMGALRIVTAHHKHIGPGPDVARCITAHAEYAVGDVCATCGGPRTRTEWPDPLRGRCQSCAGER